LLIGGEHFNKKFKQKIIELKNDPKIFGLKLKRLYLFCRKSNIMIKFNECNPKDFEIIKKYDVNDKERIGK